MVDQVAAVQCCWREPVVTVDHRRRRRSSTATIVPPPNFQGSSNLGNVFRFTSGSYIYNLDTSQLPTIGAGAHSLGFTVNGVGTYAAQFTLK